MTKSRMFFVLVAAGALLLAGCSSKAAPASGSPSVPAVGTGVSPSLPSSLPSEPSGSPTASPNPTSMAMCDAFNQLRTSITDLGSLNVLGGGGIAAVQQAVAKVRTNLDAFQAAARSDFGPEITALRTSVSNLEDSVKAAQATPGVATITQVAGNVAGVVTSFRTLRTAVSSRCG